MEKNKTFFRPKRSMEWLMYAKLSQLKKNMRLYKKFTRKIYKILKQNTKEELKKMENENGLRGKLEERSFGYEGKIKYAFNRKTGEIYFSRFKEGISITLLTAIIKDAEKE